MELQLIGTTDKEINEIIKVLLYNLSWVMTVIYASVDNVERLVLWQNMKNIADNMYVKKKKLNLNRMNKFREMLE